MSDASHELRTPVAIIKSEAEVALRLADQTDVNEFATNVLDESERLTRIVEDLLSLARRDESRTTGKIVPVDVDDIVLEEASRPRALPVDQTAVSAARLSARPGEIRRVVAHLLDNAVRHAKSKVWIGLTQDKSRMTLWVEDDGNGIRPEDREMVFRRFARLEEARTRDKGGAGLGLAVVAETVADLNGTVSIAEAPTGGARFIVRI